MSCHVMSSHVSNFMVFKLTTLFSFQAWFHMCDSAQLFVWWWFCVIVRLFLFVIQLFMRLWFCVSVLFPVCDSSCFSFCNLMWLSVCSCLCHKCLIVLMILRQCPSFLVCDFVYVSVCSRLWLNCAFVCMFIWSCLLLCACVMFLCECPSVHVKCVD